MPDQLHDLARPVYPVNPELAEEIAGAGKTTLLALGVVAPPPPPPDPIHLVDTVVCAVAEAMDLMPEAIRPALRAAFRRAKLAGLSVDTLDAGLNATKPPGATDGRGPARVRPA